jgi:hypothetical protein
MSSPPSTALSPEQTQGLLALGSALINQKAARVLVEPLERSSGYWFGGGNLVRDRDGSVLLCGRYRVYGDSRTGVHSGERGKEAAIFRAPGPEGPFEKIATFSKADLSYPDREVVSIEGVALHPCEGGIEFFVSSEKAVPYPARLAEHLKPGAGVWSIDRLSAASVAELSPASLEEVVPAGFDEPERLHTKDPWIYDLPKGDLVLGYCTHPFSWSSSGTALALRRAGSSVYEPLSTDALRRGPVWDIAAARVTCRLAVPKVGLFSDGPDLSLFFYDSCECLRQLDENPKAVSRPRGWSCEEIGGLALGDDRDPASLRSLTVEAPLFVSPHGTGCSRYVSVLADEAGLFATWQQSQEDLSQPLVGHFLPMERVVEILS